MNIPPDRDKRENGGKTGLTAALLLFLCVLAVAAFSYRKSLNPNASLSDVLGLFRDMGGDAVKEASVQYIYGYDAREGSAFAAYGDYIIKCGSGGFWFLNKPGEVVRSENVVFNKPILKVNGSMIVAAERGTGEICVLDGKSVRWREKLDASILNVDVGRDGSVAVVTTAKRDNNEVRVFEPHGIELFRKIIANDHAVSACISPNGERLLLSAIGAGTAGVYSIYKFYDMDGRDIAALSFDDGEGSPARLMPIFRFNNDDGVFISGDAGIASIDPGGKPAWEKAFYSVAGAGAPENGQLAAAAEDAKGNRLRVYAADGREIASCSLEGKIEGLYAGKGVIAVVMPGVVDFYDARCRIYGRYSPGSAIKQVLIFNKRQAAVVTDREVAVIRIG